MTPESSSRPATRRSAATAAAWSALALAGLGLPSGEGAAQEAGAPLEVPPVQVEGSVPAETGTGPVQGYVAHRTTAGTKTDTPLIETPQSVSVVTRDQIRAQNAQTVIQATRYSAGVVSQAFGFDPRYDDIYIRGFNVTEYGDYRDNLRQANAEVAYFRTEPYGLERLEVIRGPASVLYGQAGPAGIINRVTKLPSAEPFREIELQLGNHFRRQAAFDLTGPLDKDKTLLYRLTYLGRDSDSQIDDAKDNRTYLAPAFTWRPNEDTTLTFLGHYLHDKGPVDAAYFNSPEGGLTHTRVTDPAYDKLNQKQYQAGYQFEHRFSDALKVRQNLRYGYIDLNYAYLDQLGLREDGRTLDRFAYNRSDDLANLAVDNQVEGKLSTGPLGHTILGGVDYQWVHYNINASEFGVGEAPPLDIEDPRYGFDIPHPPFASKTRQLVRQTGVYAQDQIRLGGLVATLGGRHDWVDRDDVDRVAGTRDGQDDTKWSGRFGLLYLFDVGLAPYASYSTSFQPTLGTDRGGQAFEPTEGKQYEVGLKYQPSGFDGFVTLSAFHLTQKNALTTDPDDVNFQVQSGEIRSRGIELEGVASLMDGLDVIGAYTYTDLEVKKSNDLDEGKTPPGIPEHTASLWADYTHPRGPLAGLGFGAGVRYVGPTYEDAANTKSNESATYLDLAAYYEFRGARLGVNVDNLFDKKLETCNSGFCYEGEGRTIIGSLAFRW